MKISNKTKDYIVVVAICVLVIWVLTGAIYWVKSLFAYELSDIAIQNKCYTENTVQNEMRFLAMKNYMDNISEEEFAETFFKGE